jgi:capsular exopolysaccharide synthesis family protein
MQGPDPKSDATPASALDLRRFVQILLRRRWLIVGMAVLTCLVALGWSMTRPKVYRSSATVQVLPFGSKNGVGMTTEATLAKTPAVTTLAAEKLGSIPNASSLLSKLSVSSQKGTSLLDFGFTASDPVLAQAGAQAFAEAYLQNRQETRVAILEERRQDLTDLQKGYVSEITEKKEELATAKGKARRLIESDLASLGEAIKTTEIGLANIANSVSAPGVVTNPAALPRKPVSPKPARDAGIALLIGLVIGVAVALLRERLDNRIHDREQLEQISQSPVLGVITNIRYPGKDHAPDLAIHVDPKGHAAEAYRTLRTNLQFMSSVSDLHLLAITSTAANEGKTTTSVNLATAMAQTGKRVLLISADLRKPSLHRYFKFENRSGLCDVIMGDATLAGTVKQVPESPTLFVLTSGRIPPNPAEMLGSDKMATILEEAAEEYDIVILDTPPVLAVSDPLVLANRCQGVLLVVEANSTTQEGLRQSIEQLEQIGAKVMGSVLNKYDPAQARYRGYYYRYSYEYRYVDDAARWEAGSSATNGATANGSHVGDNGFTPENGSPKRKRLGRGRSKTEAKEPATQEPSEGE